MGIPRSVIFAGCARDCARFLPSVLKNIERVSSLFAQSAVVVCENDSTDATRQVLCDWGAGRTNFALVDLNGLGSYNGRTLRLEYARNVTVEVIRTWDAIRDYELLFLLDFDDINTRELDLQQLTAALEWMKPDVAGIFPNQIGAHYYDMWALRHETLCPGDIWEEVLDYHLQHKCDDQTAFQATFAKRVFSLPPDADPLEVDSAFGGFGVYRLEYALRNKSPYLGQRIKVIREGEKYSILRMQQCEHVHFHAGLRNLGGKLFVIPSLVNANTKGRTFHPAFFRTLVL